MADTFKIDVVPAHVREEQIAKVLNAPSGTEETYEVFPGRKIELKKVHLAVGLPVYRVANGVYLADRF